MSEESTRRRYSKQDRTVFSKTGKRYILSNSLISDLELGPEEIKSIFDDIVEYAKFQRMILLGDYKTVDTLKDDKGSFIYVYKKGESRRFEELIGSQKIVAFREMPLGITSEMEEKIELIDEEEERADDNIAFANNVYSSSSVRDTQNKDTREINLAFLLDNGATGKRNKKETRRLDLEELKQEGYL